MPEMTPFGWFHTIVGIAAILTGIYSLVRYKVLKWSDTSSKIYLILTFIAAASALGIYRATGAFNAAHGLAVLTIIALAGGRLTETTNMFKSLSPYLQATAYSATFLFHMIPAITDGLRRLPVGDPIVTTQEDPLLRGFYLAFLITYLVGLTLQLLWLRRQNAVS